MAQEIHDTLAQGLTGIITQLDGPRRRCGACRGTRLGRSA
jgi:signal transduction histidine kinase